MKNTMICIRNYRVQLPVENLLKPALLLLVMCTLAACGSNSKGNGTTSASIQKELGALASVPVGPTTTSTVIDGLSSPMAVTLSCTPSAGSDCLATYYTIDGTTPTRTSSLYNGPIAIWSKTTIKYFSIDKANNIEPVTTQNFLVGSINMSNVKTTAGGWDHTLALKNDGSMWAWGGNSSGQLGDGTAANRLVPVRVGTENSWSAIAAGNSFSLALKTDGSLWTWGANSSGQLGNGSTTDSNSPVNVPTAAVGTTWKTIAAGASFALAVRSDGTLWAWGSNSYGQLGNGTTTDSTVPVQVDVTLDWTAISAGYNHAVALKSNGTLWTWGGNLSGQLGTGDFDPRYTPAQVLGTDWSVISAGGSALSYAYEEGKPSRYGGHTLAIKGDGTLWAWGQNVFGQLGDGTTYNMLWAGPGTYKFKGLAVDDRSLPAQIGSDSDWSTVVAGAGHSVALKSNGTLWAWGLNVSGQLANGNPGMNNLLPLPVGPDTYLPQILPKHPWSSVSAGGYHSVALRSDGTLWAWGWNYSGQLGDNTTISTGGGSKPITWSLPGPTSVITPTWKQPKYAYVVSDKVYAYTVDYVPAPYTTSGGTTGNLNPIATGTPVSAGTTPTWAAAHPSGNYLYVTDNFVPASGDQVSKIHCFLIDRSTGQLSENGTTSVVNTLANPTSLIVDPLGKFVYVTGTHPKGWKCVAVYTVNPATGSLTISGTTAKGARSIVVEPLGKWAYILKDTVNGTGVTSYSIDQTNGMLNSLIKSIDQSQWMATYTKDDQGLIRSVDQSKWVAITSDDDQVEIRRDTAQYLAVDLSGQYLFVSTSPVHNVGGYMVRPATIYTYKINPAIGNLDYLQQSLAMGVIKPLTVSPIGLTLSGTSAESSLQFFLTWNDSNLDLLQLNQRFGSLTNNWAAETVPGGIQKIVSLPVGQAVYVLTSGYVTAYTVDASGKGALLKLGTPEMATNAKSGGSLKDMVIVSY